MKPTNSEIYRIVQDIKRVLEDHGEKLDGIVIQTTTTNGKVISLEKSRDSAAITMAVQDKTIDSFKNDRMWVIGAFVALTAIGVFAAKYFIHESVVATLSEFNIEVK